VAVNEATIMIVTRNRREEALRSVASAVRQDGEIEVLVVDDGSTDGTADAIGSRFPTVRLERFEDSAEVVARRNRAVELASAPIVIGIDDDAELSGTGAARQTVLDFDHPRVGVVALPFVDDRFGERVIQRAPSVDGVYVTQQFCAAACAVRRDAFLEVGGYRPTLEHQAEEPDLCIRMLATGHVVRLGRAEPAVHHASPRRDADLMWFRGTRNDIFFGWHNVPARRLPGYLAKQTLFELWVGARARRPLPFVRGLLSGYRDARAAGEREPVPAAAYDLYRFLGRREAVPLEEIEDLLPAAGEAAAA
jgi:glycosyltransferase involved in cell wall biosynthesis